MSIADNARKAAPALAASDEESARLHHLSDDAWTQLVDVGVLRALQPARWGGGEVTAVEFIDAITEIGRHSSSAGWVASVIGVHPWQLALFDERAQEELWSADPARPIASSYTPTGKIEKVAGGYRVSGRWSFSSGSYHCESVILGGICGEREINGASHPDFTAVVLDRPDYTIEDVWNTAGLQGTGSNDVVVSDAFVPEYRAQSHLYYTHGLGTPLPGQARNDGPLYRLPWAVLFNAIIAAGAVGAAQGFLDAWTEETRTRRTNYGGVLRDDPIVQNHLAEAAWALDAATLKLRRAAIELTEIAEAGAVPSERDRAFYRWDVTRGANGAGDAIARLMRVSSGRTAFVNHPLHRRFQDVLAALGHAFLVADPLGNAYAGRRLGSSNVPAVHL